jgi:hypothetical protein
MLNPIKRVWVPKQAESPPATPSAAPPQVAPKALIASNGLFDDMPEPEVVEKNSDSIWAEFDSFLGSEKEPK